MKRSRNSLTAIVPMALLIGALAGWTVAQESPVPPKLSGAAAEAGPPPGVGSENIPDAPRGPGEARSVADLRSSGRLSGSASESPPPGLDDQNIPGPPREPGLRGQGGGKGVGARSSKRIPGNPNPPGLEGIDDQQVPDPPARGNRSVRDLVEVLRSRPGGADKVEEAKRRGARIGAAPADRSWLAMLDPFRVSEAWAAQASFSVVLSPAAPSVTGGRLDLLGAYRGGSSNYVYLYGSYSFSSSTVNRSWVRAALNIPSDGWYIVNLYGYSCPNYADVELRAPSVNGTALETWDFADTTCGYYDNPVLLELGQGWHYLYYIASGPNYFRLHAVEAFNVDL